MHEQLFFSSTAQSLLSAKLTDEHFLNCLVDSHCFSDAVTFLAHSLNHKDGIRWAQSCISNYSPKITINDSYLLSSITNWLIAPTLYSRQQILPQKTVEQSTPAMWLALASYWSDDNEVANEHAPENLVNDAVNLINLRLSLSNIDRDWEAVLWGRNLLDEEYFAFGIDIPTVGGYAGIRAPQATVGVTVRFFN